MHKVHPFFGHTLANQEMDHFNHPLSLHGPVVHVTAVVKQVEPDAEVNGVGHYHLLLDQIQVLSIQGGDASMVGPEAFCAIRYGDNEGLSEPITDLQAGNPIELQGEYIDKNHAYPSVGNPGDPVLHFTHHPVGFVIYEGKKYE